MKKFIGLILGAGLCASINTYATTNLTIQVFNNTDTACHLEKKHLIHGFEDWSNIGDTLLPQESQEIILLESSFYGPDIELSYSCGENKTVSFELQQDYYYKSLPPENHPTILSLLSKGLTLTPAFFDKTPGIANMIISNKSS